MGDRLLDGMVSAVARERLRRQPELSDREKLARYAGRPVEFSTEVLRTTLWGDREQGQAAMAHAVVDHDRVAACTATKVGKTTMLAVLALWLYVLGWRVFLCAPTYGQLNKALWREVRRLYNQAVIKLPGVLSVTPIGGLHDVETLAHVVGLVGDKPEAFQGMSGARMAFLIDEAPGIPDATMQAIVGNLTGGGKLVMCGNPNRLTGEFYDAFHALRDMYRLFEISALDVPLSAALIDPNKPATDDNRTGLTLPAECERFRVQYGEASPFYQMRVLGKFMVAQTGRVITADVIEAAHQAWTLNDVPDDPELIIGIDPSSTLEGDDTGYAVRRGNRVLEIVTTSGMQPEGHVAHLRGLFNKHGRIGDSRIAIVDANGVGYKTFLAARQLMQNEARVIAIYSSANARRNPKVYCKLRDELWANVAERGREGHLELPPDAKLDQDLNSAKWEYHIDGRLKVTDKRVLRQELGRSPDRGDAVLLAMWWATTIQREDSAEDTSSQGADVEMLDPFAQMGTIFDGGLDPFGGR